MFRWRSLSEKRNSLHTYSIHILQEEKSVRKELQGAQRQYESASKIYDLRQSLGGLYKQMAWATVTEVENVGVKCMHCIG